MIHSCTLQPLRGITKSQFHWIRKPWNLEGLERQLDRDKGCYYGLKHWAPQVLHNVIVLGNHCYTACVSVTARMICRMGAEFLLLSYYIECLKSGGHSWRRWYPRSLQYNVRINTGPILNGYCAMGVLNSRNEMVLHATRPWTTGEWRKIFDAYLCNFKRALHNREARCVAQEGGIFEKLLSA